MARMGELTTISTVPATYHVLAKDSRVTCGTVTPLFSLGVTHSSEMRDDTLLRGTVLCRQPCSVFATCTRSHVRPHRAAFYICRYARSDGTASCVDFWGPRAGLREDRRGLSMPKLEKRSHSSRTRSLVIW